MRVISWKWDRPGISLPKISSCIAQEFFWPTRSSIWYGRNKMPKNLGFSFLFYCIWVLQVIQRRYSFFGLRWTRETRRILSARSSELKSLLIFKLRIVLQAEFGRTMRSFDSSLFGTTVDRQYKILKLEFIQSWMTFTDDGQVLEYHLKMGGY